MTEENAVKPAQPGANRGVKRGLPEVGLAAAEDAARKLWGVARHGLTPQDSFAAQWGPKNKASGGAWDRRMSLLRGFGLIKVEGDQIGLTPLGHELVNDADRAKQVEARRKAILTLKAYRELIKSIDNTPLPDNSALAARLKYDYGKTDAFAEAAAKAFVDSLRHAEMLEGEIVRSVGVQMRPTVEVEDQDDDADAEAIDRAFEETGESEASVESSGDEHDPEPADSDRLGGASRNVTLSVSLDLSSFRAEEVIQIVQALGLHRRA